MKFCGTIQIRTKEMDIESVDERSYNLTDIFLLKSLLIFLGGVQRDYIITSFQLDRYVHEK